MRFDDLDKRALLKLDDDFTIAPDGESAKIVGEMEVEFIRIADDRLQMTITFPNGEDFIVRLARAQLLE